MPIDFIAGGRASGSVADRLLASDMNVHALRPWIDKHGRTCLTVYNDSHGNVLDKPRTVLTNAPGTLTKEQWIQMDEAVLRAMRPQLKVWGDIIGAGLTYNIPNGMEVTVLQHQSMSDAGSADMSMDAIRRTNRDRVTFDLAGIPLPIVHGEFSFTLRELAVARRQRLPLDTTMIEQVTRKCVEQVEKLTIGTAASYSYAGYTIYGLTNHPTRVSASITAPTTAGWTPQQFVDDINNALQSLNDVFFTGPYGLWYSPGWTKYLNSDYTAAYAADTLMTRLGKIKDIKFWNKADYLSNFQVVIAQLTPDVIQAITGMRLTTLQWDEEGGLEKRFKIMGIMVPRIRTTQSISAAGVASTVCGIVHLTGV